MTRLTRLLATLPIALFILGGGVAAASAADAPGETTGVLPTCANLEVKPKYFADKGEVRVVVDGEVQTDGEGGWREFEGSFTNVYAFDPTVAHDYTVEINSYGASSAGRDFEPGTGTDATFTGPTTPCGPIEVVAAASNCVSPDRVDKQSINLEFSHVRAHVTYLVEVVHEGEVVTHFEFRTPTPSAKTFSGLTAGLDYRIDVTDESDPALSGSADVSIPGCAERISLDVTAASCVDGSRTSTIDAGLAGLVAGRSYTVRLSPGDQVHTVAGDEQSADLTFDDLAAGTYVVTAEDDAAPRTVSSGDLVIEDCTPSEDPEPTDPTDPADPDVSTLPIVDPTPAAVTPTTPSTPAGDPTPAASAPAAAPTATVLPDTGMSAGLGAAGVLGLGLLLLGAGLTGRGLVVRSRTH